MKTYKHLYEKMLNPETIVTCALDAAKGKIRRHDIYKSLININQTKELVLTCLTDPNYHPSEDNKHTIIDGANHKQREIEKPRFCPEQILHHMLIESFKPVLLDGLYEQVYGCLPPVTIQNKNGKAFTKKFGPHAAIRQLKKWIQINKKVYVCEADIHHAYASVHIETLVHKLARVIKDKRWLEVACKFLHYTGDQTTFGLILGHYTSPWFFNFYLKDFDHFVAALDGIQYLRFADNLFLVGRNKRKVRRALEAVKVYLRDNLGMTLNRSTQVYRFEYSKTTGKVVGRAVNALGAVLHYNRCTLRKSILRRARRKAIHIHQKGYKVTWHDGSSLFSLLSWLKHTQTQHYYCKWIRPNVRLHLLKTKIQKHSREIAPLYKEIWSYIQYRLTQQPA